VSKILAPFAGICSAGFAVLAVVLCVVHSRDPTLLENDSFFTVELGVLVSLCVSLQVFVISLAQYGGTGLRAIFGGDRSLISTSAVLSLSSSQGSSSRSLSSSTTSVSPALRPPTAPGKTTYGVRGPMSSASMPMAHPTSADGLGGSGSLSSSGSADPATQQLAGAASSSSSSSSSSFGSWSEWRPGPFRRFQATYLIVYMMMLFADWLQGPYVYQLYASYGYTEQQSADLFMAGFSSALVFGFFAGTLADRLGRKRLCLVCAVTYALACATKPFPNYWVLFTGRVLAGIATSLLWSVFEAWMVSEHHERGFEHAALASTFAASTFGSGVIAIGAGIIAHELTHHFGYLAPFMMAMGVLIAAAFVIAKLWTENVGEPSGTSVRRIVSESLAVVFGDRRVFFTGVVQASFEATMYIFVFVWTPTMAHGAARPNNISLGLIFSVFMTCMMIGSALFRLAQRWYSAEAILTITVAVSILALLIPALTNKVHMIINGFLIFEVACGVYFPAIACLRSEYVPETVRTAVINLFRVPLNLVVVLLLSDVSRLSDRSVFQVCIGVLLIGLIAQAALWQLARRAAGAPIVYARDTLRPSVMHETMYSSADERVGLLYENNQNK
jgi:MFS family permease